MIVAKDNKRNIVNLGFTIVELLIVIVVVAILAAISIVAYNGIQTRARDSMRQQDLAALSKALKLYRVDNDNLVSAGSGCGMGGTGTGWVSKPSYARSVVECLMDGKYINANIIDPSGCSYNGTNLACAPPTTTAYMKLDCTTGSSNFSYLMARMEASSMNKPADMTAAACVNDVWWSYYGMNYALKVE